MSEPEIARRCLNCGASVRGRATFCPQCGSRMDAAGESHPVAAAKVEPQKTPPRGSLLVEEAERVAATLNDKLPTLSGETPADGQHKAAPEREREPQGARVEAAPAAPRVPQSPGREESGAKSSAQPVESQAEARGRVGRRAATVGASVGQNLRPRVERLREASTVVFDEATDDPGLRFIIVAAVLFLLFLFIFLFSYILG